jgi:hypothetical protein
MNAKLLAAAAALVAGSGCIVVDDEPIEAGESLDAHFQLTWATNDVRTGREIDCRSAGADTVRVRARNLTSGDEIVDLFDCDAKSGETSALPAGDYSVSVDLVACAGDAICAAPNVISALAERRSRYSIWSDTDIDLGHFVFLVD